MAPLKSKLRAKASLARRRTLAFSALVGASALLASTFSSREDADEMEFDPERALASDRELGSGSGRSLANTVQGYDDDQSVTLPPFYANVGNVWDVLVDDDQPMLWYIPRTGANTLSKIMTRCLDFVSANSVPGRLEGGLVPTTHLQVNTLSDGGRYVNLDFSDLSHFATADDWSMVSGNHADVLTTQHIAEASGLFRPDHRGRIFAMLRHPVKRAVDMFFYRQKATFDPDFERDVATMSLKEYARSGHHVENFVVRTLLDKHGVDVTPGDVETAKHVLRRKVIVGIAEERWFDVSVVRFEKYFGWWEKYGVIGDKTVNHCHYKMIKTGGHFGTHPKIKPTSDVYNILASRNWADMELYMYAKRLFKRQAALVKPAGYTGDVAAGPGPEPEPAPAPAPAPAPETTTAAPTSPPADDGCVGEDPSKFNICLDSTKTGTYSSGDWTLDVASAKTRWQSVVVGDLPGTYDIADLPADYNCGSAPSNVDDLYVCAKDPAIDGPYGVLGSAGPTMGAYVSTPVGTRVLPVSGRMSFDSADIERMMAAGTWGEVVTHEIGHILGIGSLWDVPAWGHDLVTDAAPFYYKAGGSSRACAKWREITSCAAGSPQECPPVENEGGAGTAGGHWDEDVMGAELMSGYVGDGTSPLSVVTLGALEDLGYTVDYGNADPYTFGDTCPTAGGARRRLSVRALGDNQGRRQLSSAGAAKAVQYANDELDKAEAAQESTLANVGAANPDVNVVFLANEFVSVYYAEGDAVFQLDVTRHHEH